MPEIQPEQAQFLLHVYLPMLQREHQITKGVIAAIPDGAGDYRPDPNAKSGMELAWHIVSTEARFLNAVVNGRFDFTPNPKPDSIQNAADLTRWYEQNFPQWLQRVENLPNEQLTKSIDFRGIFNLPAVMYLGFISNHSIHHRGQLSVYLRPMGGKVPAIYGESYDSAQAKKAGGA